MIKFITEFYRVQIFRDELVDIAIDEVGGVIYIGIALAGTARNSRGWFIVRTKKGGDRVTGVRCARTPGFTGKENHPNKTYTLRATYDYVEA